MKLLLVFCIVGVTLAVPAPEIYRSGQSGQLITSYNDNNGLGKYRFGYALTGGTRREEQGQLKNEGREDESIVVRGSYSYISPEGIRVTVIYVADDNGYHTHFYFTIQKGSVVPYSYLPPEVLASLLSFRDSDKNVPEVDSLVLMNK